MGKNNWEGKETCSTCTKNLELVGCQDLRSVFDGVKWVNSGFEEIGISVLS